jgi:hypothetical protein
VERSQSIVVNGANSTRVAQTFSVAARAFVVGKFRGMKLTLVAIVLMSCAHAPKPAPRLGEAMWEAGWRFQRAGQAARAGRWDLARYDLHELDEVFAEDIARAETHDEKVDIHKLAREFAQVQLPAMRAAVDAHDMQQFNSAIVAAAKSCNDCHKLVDKPFIEVPLEAGAEVPLLTPIARTATK